MSQFNFESPSERIMNLKTSIQEKLKFVIGKEPALATEHDWLNAVSFVVRDMMVERWLRSTRAHFSQSGRRVSYLSMEFLIGRTLSNSLLNLGIYDELSEALGDMGLNIEQLIGEEDDPGLGNGGL